MSVHLYNTVCPSCRKIGRDKAGDNLAVYDDGHSYCWACGYWSPPTGISRSYTRTAPVERPTVYLPSDVDSYIPMKAREWLNKYEITENEIISNKLLWSDFYEQLIFPYFGENNTLLGWQGRSFAEGKRKWFTQGDIKSIYHILPLQEKYDTIVLVEDIVSSIKVSRVCPAMPLFGSTCLGRLKTLSMLSKQVVLWLDPDMKAKAAGEAFKARSLGLEARVVWSERDPKEHTNEEIKNYLTKTG